MTCTATLGLNWAWPTMADGCVLAQSRIGPSPGCDASKERQDRLSAIELSRPGPCRRRPRRRRRWRCKVGRILAAMQSTQEEQCKRDPF